jgi:hypothetical protein
MGYGSSEVSNKTSTKEIVVEEDNQIYNMAGILQGLASIALIKIEVLVQ